MGSNLHWFFLGRMELAHQLSDAIFQGYLAGLRQAGWHGDSRIIRYVYCAVAGTIFGLAYTTAVRRILSEDPDRWARNNYDCSAAEALKHRALMALFFLDLADEARLLAAELT